MAQSAALRKLGAPQRVKTKSRRFAKGAILRYQTGTAKSHDWHAPAETQKPQIRKRRDSALPKLNRSNSIMAKGGEHRFLSRFARRSI